MLNIKYLNMSDTMERKGRKVGKRKGGRDGGMKGGRDG